MKDPEEYVYKTFAEKKYFVEKDIFVENIDNFNQPVNSPLLIPFQKNYLIHTISLTLINNVSK